MQNVESKQTQMSRQRPSLLSRDSSRGASFKATPMSPKSPTSPTLPKSGKKPEWNDCVVVEESKGVKNRPQPLKARSKTTRRRLKKNKGGCNESSNSIGTMNSLNYMDLNTHKYNAGADLMSPKRGPIYSKTLTEQEKFFGTSLELNFLSDEASKTHAFSPKRRSQANLAKRGTPLHQKSSMLASLAVTD